MTTGQHVAQISPRFHLIRFATGGEAEQDGRGAATSIVAQKSQFLRPMAHGRSVRSARLLSMASAHPRSTVSNLPSAAARSGSPGPRDFWARLGQQAPSARCGILPAQAMIALAAGVWRASADSDFASRSTSYSRAMNASAGCASRGCASLASKNFLRACAQQSTCLRCLRRRFHRNRQRRRPADNLDNLSGSLLVRPVCDWPCSRKPNRDSAGRHSRPKIFRCGFWAAWDRARSPGCRPCESHGNDARDLPSTGTTVPALGRCSVPSGRAYCEIIPRRRGRTRLPSDTGADDR